MFKNKSFLINYCTSQYPFRKLLESILETEDITKLHEVDNSNNLVKRENDSYSKWHSLFYKAFEVKFKSHYLNFMENFIMPYFNLEKNTLIYQKIPSFRAHLVHNLAVGEWHRDRDYNHDTNEMNFWLPFMNTYDTNTIWMESEENKGDIKPYSVDYGQILVFSGANLLHGNKINETTCTRTSIDFRLVEKDMFNPSSKQSINMRTKFDVGGYFEIM